MRMLGDGGIAVGEGVTPGGRGWRLQISVISPDRISLSVDVSGEPSHTAVPRTKWARGGGTGPPMSSDALVSCRLIQRGDGIQAIVGEVVPYAAKVRVHLDSEREVCGEIVRSEVTPHDYFVAFGPDEGEVVTVVAADEDSRVLGEARRSEERVQHSRDFRQRLLARRGEAPSP
jgi:hypothetical protein